MGNTSINGGSASINSGSASISGGRAQTSQPASSAKHARNLERYLSVVSVGSVTDTQCSVTDVGGKYGWCMDLSIGISARMPGST
eukprot:409070-Rhodomonas_salina.2